MYPPVWGPATWDAMHHFAFAYPEKPSKERAEQMTTFLESICGNLPCPQCGVHCSVYMVQNPPAVESRGALIKWVIDFHNNVNERTGKRVYSYEEVEELQRAKFYNLPNFEALSRSMDIRREDHKVIKALQENIKSLDPDNTLTRNQHEHTVIIGVLAVTLALVTILYVFALVARSKSTPARS